MANSWIACARPENAAPKGYDTEAGSQRVWRLQVPVGSSREIDVLALEQAQAIELLSNDPKVVDNTGFAHRRNGARWTATIKGLKIGTTLITVGFTPPPGGFEAKYGLPAMPIGAAFGPVILQVQVTRADGTMPGNDLSIPPEGQLDPMACWAACLAWWTRAVPDVTTRTQMSILGASGGVTLRDGSIQLDGIVSFFASQSALRAERIPAPKLPKYIAARRFPMIIGFASGPLGGHVNVIHAYDEAKATVTVMEPWFPDPVGNAAYEFSMVAGSPVYSAKQGGAPFKFTGKHIVRPLNYYTTKPLNGQFIVAYSSALPGIRAD